MRKKTTTIIATLAAFAFGVAFLVPQTASAADEAYSIARGGKLYDKWWPVNGAAKPEPTHKSWPASNTKKKGNVTWRCKSCHGWDFIGKDGLYASGSYMTGIKGVSAYAGKGAADIVAIIRDGAHGYTEDMLSKDDANDLALFVSKGVFNLDKYIDRAKKTPIGADKAKGKDYYETVCVGCHAFKGNKPKDLPVSLGNISRKNPWRIINKILNGQPGADMPAMRAMDMQVALDLLAHLQTLPDEM